MPRIGKKRITPSSVYLGEDRKELEAKLDELAVELKFPNRSQLIRAIANGEIKLKPRNPAA